MRLVCFCSFVLLCFFASGQQQIEAVGENQFYTRYSFTVNHSPAFDLTFDNPASAVMVKKISGDTFTEGFLLVDNDTLLLIPDNHNSLGNETSSRLYTFDDITENLTVHMTGIEGDYELHVFHAGHGTYNLPYANKVEGGACEEPTSINHNVWRYEPTELPHPIIYPTETVVQHVIVHHSAGSNSATNYQDIVRNIYLLHTQVNGWDDIGYNYLIAPDGTVFLGRDSQGLFDHDNTRGAHMCNKNNATMAICLLGDYEQVSPPDVMISALEHVISWKFNKELINPMDSSIHPIGPNSANLEDDFLPHIAGHRQGCAEDYTVCPGRHVYDKLDSIRANVESDLTTCFVGFEEFMSDNDIRFYYDTNTGKVSIQSNVSILEIRVFDVEGRQLDAFITADEPDNVEWFIPSMNSQLRVLQIVTRNGVGVRRIY